MNKKNTCDSANPTYPIFSAYPKVFIVNFTQALLKSGPLSLYSPYKKINKNTNISLPTYLPY